MRKEITITIQDGDTNKNFKIRQMAATKQERWINRVVLLVLGSEAGSNLLGGLDLSSSADKLQDKLTNPAELLQTLASFGYEKVEPLYNDLLECCAYIPDGSNANYSQPLTALNADSMIESFKTLYRLRIEALKLNFGFFGGGAISQDSTLARQTARRIKKNI